MKRKLKLILIFLWISIVSCDNHQQREQDFINHAKQQLGQGDYAGAALAFNNALQINSDDNQVRSLYAGALMKNGQLGEAVEQYKTIIERDKQNTQARIKLAAILYANGRKDSAQHMLTQALAIDSEHNEALILKAKILTDNKNTDAAIVIMQQVLGKQPDIPDALIAMADIQMKIGRLVEARKFLEKAISVDHSNEDAYLHLARLFLRQQDYAKAEIQLIKLTELAPHNVNHFQRLAVLYVALKQLDRAEQVLRDSLNKASDQQKPQFALIDFLARHRNVEVAIAELIPMVESDRQGHALRFKLASLYIQQKDQDSAQEILREVSAQNGFEAEGLKARVLLAELAYLKRDIQQAEQLLEKVLENAPTHPEGLILRGKLALSEGREGAAVRDFRQVLTQQPRNVGVLKLLASAHQANKAPVLAQENLEKVLQLNPLDVDARRDLLDVLFRAGNAQSASGHIQALLSIDEKDSIALSYLFRLKLAQRDWQGAQQTSHLIQSLSPEHKATGLYLSGLAYQAAGQYQQSIDTFKQSLATKPDAVEPLAQMVKSYIAQQQPTNAAKYLQGLVKKETDHFVAYNLLGEVYTHQQKYKPAAKAFNKAIKHKPEWNKPYLNLASIRVKQKDATAAIKVLQQGVKATDYQLQLVSPLAQLFHAQGKVEDVLSLFESCYKANPRSLIARNNLASYMADTSEAKDQLDKAEKLAKPLEKTGTPEFLDTAGWIAYKQGKHEKARELLEKAINSGTPKADQLYHLGMVYAQLGAKTKAKHYLEKAISGKQEFTGKKQAIDLLKTL